ncbi:MAG: PAS domain-containing protein, partial [Pseudomonadota bacterium]
MKQLEKRAPLNGLVTDFADLFEQGSAGPLSLTDRAGNALLEYIAGGDASYQSVAVQAGVRWTGVSRRVALRNAIIKRGFLTSACLWGFRQLRGRSEELFHDYPSPEMAYMQVILLKESDPAEAIPFLIERFLTRKEAGEELRAASRLCILRLLDSAGSPQLLRELQKRYPDVEILSQWRSTLIGHHPAARRAAPSGPVDFHQLLRSVHDMKELSSLTRTLYLLSVFYVPLTEKEWADLFLGTTDYQYFQRFVQAGVAEAYNGGYMLSNEPSKQNLVTKYLYESYSLAKQSVHRNRTERVKAEMSRRVRNSELDRQALEMVPDGIICVDRTGRFYYINPAAEKMLADNYDLKERLFGKGPIEDALRKYDRGTVLAGISAWMRENGTVAEIHGDRVALYVGGRKFQIELHPHIILLKDVTDQHLIDEEVGRLYRHELKAALDVMGAGLETAKQLLKEGVSEEGLECLGQVENKRAELLSMLEERMDFIRL